MKKLFVFTAVALCSVAITGCKRGSGEYVDNTRAQLRIVTFDGGVGDQWLKNAARLFEEKNADRDDFQDGRVGVQIHVSANRGCTGGLLEYSDLNDDIYFTENIDYYKLTNQNKLADITDILTAPIAEEGGNTILDKIAGNLKNYMNRDGKYYAVPFYDCFYGLVYDKDLFKQNSLYLKNDGSFTNDKNQFGTGPNGVAGDWDDGLPRTYAEFDSMMKKMVVKNITPFTYSSGNSTYYTARALTSWWSDDEGYEQTNLNYTFNGQANNIITNIDDSGNYSVKTVQITKQNGYELRAQAGIYNALHFARDILTSSSNNYQAYSSNYDVQDAFINNKNAGGSAKPIAMMFEGTWWENEAAQSFDEARSYYGVEEFHYGFMPIPKASESKIGDATLMNLNDSYGFISASCENMKLAKEFFAFLHTDEQMKNFTRETNMTRGLQYEFSESDFDQISSYAQDLVSIKNSEHAKVVYPYSGLDFVINNSDTFSTKSWPWSTKSYTDNPIIKFIDDKGLSAKTYFNDHVSALGSTEWSRIIN